MVLNSLPSNKILDWSKLKEFADKKTNVTQKWKFILGRVENIVGKGENAGYQHFLLFPRCFQKFVFNICVIQELSKKKKKKTIHSKKVSIQLAPSRSIFAYALKALFSQSTTQFFPSIFYCHDDKIRILSKKPVGNTTISV